MYPHPGTVPEDDAGPTRTDRRLRDLRVVVTVATVLGVGWMMITGVSALESCSAEVGSVELPYGTGTDDGDPTLYRPCQLIGYVEVAAGLAAGVMVAAMFIRDDWLRVRIVALGVVIVIGLTITGLRTLVI